MIELFTDCTTVILNIAGLASLAAKLRATSRRREQPQAPSTGEYGPDR